MTCFKIDLKYCIHFIIIRVQQKKPPVIIESDSDDEPVIFTFILKILPFGGRLNEKEADTSKTRPSALDRKMFQDAKENAKVFIFVSLVYSILIITLIFIILYFTVVIY